MQNGFYWAQFINTPAYLQQTMFIRNLLFQKEAKRKKVFIFPKKKRISMIRPLYSITASISHHNTDLNLT